MGCPLLTAPVWTPNYDELPTTDDIVGKPPDKQKRPGKDVQMQTSEVKPWFPDEFWGRIQSFWLVDNT